MSHFTVLVIGSNVDAQLAPFHEFESTGRDDQYVQDIDKTEEARAAYEDYRRSMVRLADGREVPTYADEFYRDPTDEELKKIGPFAGTGGCNGLAWSSRDWNDGKGYRTKVHYLPEGAVEFEKPFDTFADYLRYAHDENFVVLFGGEPDLEGDHKLGYALVDEKGEVTKVVDRTNPNAHWDWYEIGGRWSGHLRLKDGRMVNQAKKGAIDFEGMRDAAGREAGETWDEATKVIAGRSFMLWDETRKEYGDDIDKARDVYNAQDVIKDFRKARGTFGLFTDPADFRCTREEYVQAARDRAISTFAVVRDSKWYARGETGWWGTVHNKMDEKEWLQKFAELIDDLPDDTLLTVVDCHI